MKKLYAPWRTNYTNKEAHTKSETAPQDDCVFCRQFQANEDDRYYILKRFENTAVMLNLYPYNTGHILILPLSHTRELEGLEAKIRHEIMDVLALSIRLAKETLGCEGLNIGANLGKAAGAGIPSHLHLHIVPRWNGDTNFLPVIGETKAISTDLNDVFRKLKAAFDAQ